MKGHGHATARCCAGLLRGVQRAGRRESLSVRCGVAVQHPQSGGQARGDGEAAGKEEYVEEVQESLQKKASAMVQLAEIMADQNEKMLAGLQRGYRI